MTKFVNQFSRHYVARRQLYEYKCGFWIDMSNLNIPISFSVDSITNIHDKLPVFRCIQFTSRFFCGKTTEKLLNTYHKIAVKLTASALNLFKNLPTSASKGEELEKSGIFGIYSQETNFFLGVCRLIISSMMKCYA